MIDECSVMRNINEAVAVKKWIATEFPAYLRKKIEQSGLSLRGFSEKVNKSPAYVSRVKNGKIKASANFVKIIFHI